MAAIMAWLAANWAGVVVAVVAAIAAYVNKGAIKTKMGWGQKTMADDGESSLDALLRRIAEKIQPLFDKLGMRGDAAKRALHQFFLICMEDDIAALPDSPEKTEQLAAIQTLAKYRVRSAEPEPEPVARRR